MDRPARGRPSDPLEVVEALIAVPAEPGVVAMPSAAGFFGWVIGGRPLADAGRGRSSTSTWDQNAAAGLLAGGSWSGQRVATSGCSTCSGCCGCGGVWLRDRRGRRPSLSLPPGGALHEVFCWAGWDVAGELRRPGAPPPLRVLSAAERHETVEAAPALPRSGGGV